MLVSEIIYWIFGIGAIISGLMVISSTNPMHSVFALVLTFVNASVLLLLLGIEFLAILFLIVYVGAIAILFLFVVMMLNIKLVEIRDNATRYVPVGFLIGLIFLFEILIIVDKEIVSSPNQEFSVFLDPTGSINDLSGLIYNSTNVQLLGQLLYTEYYLLFIIASLILLVAMIGAIVLTLYHEEEVKRQDIFAQISTDPQKTIIKY